MKRILFLLLLTVSVYGQNPSRFAKIQITGNTNSGTATKVNVQEANGEVNTQTINTGFNKNIGLNTGDVVGANTLLNQYSTTPSDWTAQSYVLNNVVFYAGKQWIANMATVADDVPSVSSKWEKITFEALANKTKPVDQTIIDGSTNSVSGNAVFDGLALKSNIGHTHVASQITDLSKASVGLGNVDNTSDLSKPLSTATINALATKAPISSVHNPVTIGTANGLSLSTQQLSLGLASSGVTGALSGTDWNTFNNKQNALTNPITGTGVAGQISFWSGTGTQIGDSGLTWNGTNGLVSTKQIILDAQNTAFIIGNNTPTNFAQFYYNSVNKALQFTKSNGDNTIVVKDVTGNVGINQVLPTEKLDVVGNGKFSGTISASPATTANQVVVKSQLDAAASSGRYTPTGNVITGATSVSVQSHTYIKIGNIVTVYGESLPTPVVTGVPVIYEISLPIARANTATKALGFGTMNVAGGSTNQPVRLESSSATTVRISFNVSAAGTPSVLYSLQYDITQ